MGTHPLCMMIHGLSSHLCGGLEVSLPHTNRLGDARAAHPLLGVHEDSDPSPWVSWEGVGFRSHYTGVHGVGAGGETSAESSTFSHCWDHFRALQHDWYPANPAAIIAGAEQKVKRKSGSRWEWE